MRLFTGKSVSVPGDTTGNNADVVHKIIDRHHKFMKRLREAEYEDKILKASRIKSSQI